MLDCCFVSSKQQDFHTGQIWGLTQVCMGKRVSLKEDRRSYLIHQSLILCWDATTCGLRQVSPAVGLMRALFSWRAISDPVVIPGRWIWIGEIDTSNRLVVSCKSLCFCISYVKRKRSKAKHNNKKYFARLILLQGQLSVCHGSEHHCPTKRRPGNEWPNKGVLGSWQANMLVSFKNILS